MPSTPVDRALAAIDSANSEDPNLIPDGTVHRPKELVHAERMAAWLHVLAPDADDAQRLAARAHHFRRWTTPRTDYPAGRAGYLRWRRDAHRRHAEEVGGLLRTCGVDEEVIADTMRIVTKDGLRTDPRVQVHEDALCLVFFELQGLSTAALLGERTERVVAKTLAKMSDFGRSHLAEASIAPEVRAVIDAALSPEG